MPRLPCITNEQGFHPEEQGGLGGFKDGPGPEAELLATAAAGTDLGAGAESITLFGLTSRTLNVLALKTTAPEQGTGISFRRDLSKKAFSSEGFIEHQTPPQWGEEATEGPRYTTARPCVHFPDRHTASGPATTASVR